MQITEHGRQLVQTDYFKNAITYAGVNLSKGGSTPDEIANAWILMTATALCSEDGVPGIATVEEFEAFVNSHMAVIQEILLSFVQEMRAIKEARHANPN